MAPELERTRPRHYVLFVIEPLFLLARVSAGDSGVSPDVVSALSGMVEFARSVPAGAIEAETDNDTRHGIRLAWYSRILARWAGQEVPAVDPDGSAWEGGWNQASRLAWAMV
jgi:hypothetical protein